MGSWAVDFLGLALAERMKSLFGCCVLPTYAMTESVPICSHSIGENGGVLFIAGMYNCNDYYEKFSNHV
jgi:acyl-CoA synthetase (AMP-forming)/AMP-acid ligase II